MENNAWYKHDIQESIYLGWRGFGTLFGTRYYLNVGESLFKTISRSPFSGVKLRIVPASAILSLELRRPSFFYAITGAFATFIYSLRNAAPEDLHSESVAASLIAILILFFYSLVVGVVIERLYERPYISLLLEGGERLKIFTNFDNKLSEIVHEIELARGVNISESMRSSHSYYTYQLRGIHTYIDPTPKKRKAGSLVIAIAIIGILAAIAIPAYTDYIRRSKVSEAIMLLSGLRIRAEEWMVEKGDQELPTVEQIGGKSSGKYTESIWQLSNCYFAIINRGEEGIGGKSLKLCYDHDVRYWECSTVDMPEQYLPLSCMGINQEAIESTMVQKEGTIDSILTQMATEINEQGPMMIDENIRFDTMMAINRTIRYNYTLVNYAAEELDPKAFEQAMKHNLINYVCTANEMEIFVKNNIPVSYAYYGKNGNQITVIKVPASSCRNGS